MSDNHLKKLLNNQEWYHQRFDGAPMYLYFIVEAQLKKEKRKPNGTQSDVLVSFFGNDSKADWYINMKEIRLGSKVIINLAKRNKNIGSVFLGAWKKDEKKFDNFFDKYKFYNLKKFSDKDLLNFFNEFHTLYINRITSSSLIDNFALGTDEIIADMLRKEIKGIKKESDFTECFSIATAPVHQSFINKAEMDLLKIALQTPASKKKIEEYQKKYFWIKNNYFEAKILSADFFAREIQEWKKMKIDLKERYLKIKNTALKNKRNKLILFKRYNLSELLKALLKISEDFTWWQDERKRSTFLNIHLGSRILEEMSRRRKIDPKLSKYLLPMEVEGWFLHDKISTSELRQRRQKSCFVGTRGKYYILTGEKCDKVKKNMFASHEKDVIKDLRGLSASVGVVSGYVKVIGSVKEVNKINPGDILVAVMTRPDYIAGIRKAAAIVTDEGGITCHAAIVAREFGIPCIIGTKIATKILKDGDFVEVNANHGVVKIK
jgi:phosphohistidine swiveling domain-containing protein